MPALTKIRTVCPINSMTDLSVGFGTLDPDDESHHRGVTIRVGDWLDMGRPEQVTITVEPGDLLDEEE